MGALLCRSLLVSFSVLCVCVRVTHCGKVLCALCEGTYVHRKHLQPYSFPFKSETEIKL